MVVFRPKSYLFIPVYTRSPDPPKKIACNLPRLQKVFQKVKMKNVYLHQLYFKGVSGRRLTCVFVVIGGILVCTVPQLIPAASNNLLQRATHHHLGYPDHDNDTERKSTSDTKTWYQHAFWVLIYASGHVAVVMMTITMEKLINFRERVSELTLCFLHKNQHISIKKNELDNILRVQKCGDCPRNIKSMRPP